MIIDNFELIKKHLLFNNQKDRYVIHILQRKKDNMNNVNDCNKSQRLIKTYYINNIEYFEKKISTIKEICKTTNSRAYIIISPKDIEDCLFYLNEKILQILRYKNYNVDLEHLVRSAFCENHHSTNKRWILDLDNDEMYGWTVEDVVSLVKRHVIEAGKNPDDIFIVPTKNGCHIITPPFNIQNARQECKMIFEGVLSFDFINFVKKTGWLHKDGMTLLYYNNEEQIS